MNLSELVTEDKNPPADSGVGLIIDALKHVGANARVISELKKLRPHQEIIDLAVRFYNGAASLGSTLNTLEQVVLAAEKLRIDDTLGTYLVRLETQTGTSQIGLGNLDELLKAINTVSIFKYEQAPYLRAVIPVFKAIVELHWAARRTGEGDVALGAAVARSVLRQLGVTREAQ